MVLIWLLIFKNQNNYYVNILKPLHGILSKADFMVCELYLKLDSSFEIAGAGGTRLHRRKM